MNFCIVLHELQSPQNVGTIVRSLAAFGGDKVIITGNELPWRFKKGSQAFSRKLEKLVKIDHSPSIKKTVSSLRDEGYEIIAIEIKEQPKFINQFSFNKPSAFIFGNEGKGLSLDIQKSCDHVLTIPQFTDVGSLNVGVAASIVMYERMRKQSQPNVIKGSKFGEISV